MTNLISHMTNALFPCNTQENDAVKSHMICSKHLFQCTVVMWFSNSKSLNSTLIENNKSNTCNNVNNASKMEKQIETIKLHYAFRLIHMLKIMFLNCSLAFILKSKSHRANKPCGL